MIDPTRLALGFLCVVPLLLGVAMLAPWFTQREALERSVAAGPWVTTESFRGHDAATACQHALMQRRLAVEGSITPDPAGAQLFRCTPQ